MTGGRPSTRRAAAALVAVAASAAMACGGGGGDAPDRPAPAPQPAAAIPRIDVPAETGAVAAVDPARLQRLNAERAKVAERAGERRARRSARRAAGRTRRATARRVAAGMADAMGFEDAVARVTRDGERVTVELPRDACRRGDDQLAKRVLRALPYVRSVRVDGGAETCAPSLVAEAGGRLLYARRGRGAYVTRTIDVRAQRWTVDYAARAGFFQLVVTRGDDLAGPPLLERDDPEGQQTFTGTGPVRLRIAADGAWTVRVRAAARG